MQRLSQQGGSAYEVVKMYSLEDYNFQSQQIIANQSYLSDSSSQSSSSNSNESEQEIKSKNSSDHQDNKNNMKKKLIQENQNKLLLQPTNQSQNSMSFQENITQNSEHTKQTIKTFECPNSLDFYTTTEKKLQQEDTQQNLPSCETYTHIHELKIPSLIESKKTNGQQQSQSHKEIHDNAQCPSFNQINLVEQKIETNAKPTKQAFIQKCYKDQTKQIGEIESNKSVLFSSNKQQKMKAIVATTSDSFKIQDSNFHENSEYSRSNHRKKNASKTKFNDEEQNTLIQHSSNLQPLMSKMQSSFQIVEELLKESSSDKRQRTFNEKQICESSQKSEAINLRNQFLTSQYVTALAHTLECQNTILTDKNIVELMLADILTKKSTSSQQKNIIINGSSQMQQFDKMQIFSCFFPHNNFNQVIKNIRVKKSHKYIKKLTQKINTRRQNIYMQDQIQIKSFIQKVFTGNQYTALVGDLQSTKYNPTTLSYGICTKKTRLYPIKKNSL